MKISVTTEEINHIIYMDSLKPDTEKKSKGGIILIIILLVIAILGFVYIYQNYFSKS